MMHRKSRCKGWIKVASYRNAMNEVAGDLRRGLNSPATIMLSLRDARLQTELNDEKRQDIVTGSVP